MFNWLSYILILPIKIYQWVLSPILGQNCRHTPTCSHYAVEALKVWGPFQGLYLAIRRVLRCHPWNDGGYDPVPKRKR